MESLVSVVVLTRNSAKTLNSCLDSVVNQTYRNTELVVADKSEDSTIDIAEHHSAKIVHTEKKLLAAKYIGYKNSKGAYVLYSDSDQILHTNTLEHAINIIQDYDMMCLEEESYEPLTFLEKLIDADRKLVNDHAILQLDPLKGVLIPRLYRPDLLDSAFQEIPLDERVGILRKAILHIEPSSIYQFCYKSYQYGKSTKQLRGTNLYLKLLKKKALLRKGIKLDQRSMESIILFLVRNIPFFVGVCIGRLSR